MKYIKFQDKNGSFFHRKSGELQRFIYTSGRRKRIEIAITFSGRETANWIRIISAGTGKH